MISPLLSFASRSFFLFNFNASYNAQLLTLIEIFHVSKQSQEWNRAMDWASKTEWSLYKIMEQCQNRTKSRWWQECHFPINTRTVQRPCNNCATEIKCNLLLTAGALLGPIHWAYYAKESLMVMLRLMLKIVTYQEQLCSKLHVRSSTACCPSVAAGKLFLCVRQYINPVWVAITLQLHIFMTLWNPTLWRFSGVPLDNEVLLSFMFGN